MNILSIRCIFSVVILLLFILENVYGITCNYRQQTCTDNTHVWCCSYDESCGNYLMPCYSYRTTTSFPTPSFNMPAALVTVLVIVSIFFFGICLSCCVGLKQQQQHQQQRASNVRILSNERTIRPYQQQSPPTVHIRSVYSTNATSSASRTHNICEEQPPSYEAAVANLSSKYQIESSSSSTATATTLHTQPLVVTESITTENTRF